MGWGGEALGRWVCQRGGWSLGTAADPWMLPTFLQKAQPWPHDAPRTPCHKASGGLEGSADDNQCHQGGCRHSSQGCRQQAGLDTAGSLPVLRVQRMQRRMASTSSLALCTARTTPLLRETQWEDVTSTCSVCFLGRLPQGSDSGLLLHP